MYIYKQLCLYFKRHGNASKRVIGHYQKAIHLYFFFLSLCVSFPIFLLSILAPFLYCFLFTPSSIYHHATQSPRPTLNLGSFKTSFFSVGGCQLYVSVTSLYFRRTGPFSRLIISRGINYRCKSLYRPPPSLQLNYFFSDAI